jgi:hypothetical protein
MAECASQCRIVLCSIPNRLPQEDVNTHSILRRARSIYSSDFIHVGADMTMQPDQGLPARMFFVDCVAEQTNADIGPHHRYATGILFDNIQGGQMRVWNRGSMGTGHGWAGAQTMFWNLESPTNEIKVDSPPHAMNWGIGCTGNLKTGAGYWEKWGTHVLPRSLYYQQLQDRLGEDAVLNTTISAQHSGRIYEVIKNWKGFGELTEYLPSNNPNLADLRVNNETVMGFTPSTIDYTMEVTGNNIHRLQQFLISIHQ